MFRQPELCQLLLRGSFTAANPGTRTKSRASSRASCDSVRILETLSCSTSCSSTTVVTVEQQPMRRSVRRKHVRDLIYMTFLSADGYIENLGLRFRREVNQPNVWFDIRVNLTPHRDGLSMPQAKPAMARAG